MFTLDPGKSYMMPAHFGPRHFGQSAWYHDITVMTVSYVTDAEMIAALLPEGFSVANPVISVQYGHNGKVDWLAGRGYNYLKVSASAVYKGQEDHLVGEYVLVMWENLTDPILVGRETQGIPKIFADIPDHYEKEGQWLASASLYGNPIASLEVGSLRAPTQEEMEAAAVATHDKDHPLTWRYMPAVGGYGDAINEIATYPSETVYEEVLVGEGSVNWHQLTWEQNPTQFHIVNALEKLPVLAPLPATKIKCSANLSVPEKKSRPLR